MIHYSLQGLLFEISMALHTVFQIRLRRNMRRSRILAGYRKTAGFRPEPESKSGTALTNSSLRFIFVLSLTFLLCTDTSADAAEEVAGAAVKPAVELNPNSTDEEKLLQSSALAYSCGSDFDLSAR